ncbi:MAG: hypothetical protein A3D44_00520 [Candidatus Staskawiczbacteria bacterium RIFCSPHIGHO2_02_FULL_42_22]|uniref:Uncharacterized protein n=1 Tax=Candidatus Staskawiczbacteria bacterium RIFCSPHIGHO2_02_FULL_42_22 TaxID=1802207 RepID=A0A1G2I5L4_9BACT|nr:MAG: hypothetical protein A3D44_00520 [Candidatus Staskawiczbacteria bacterium RIFCSPHIGHO2_02_FULL_42_22]
MQFQTGLDLGRHNGRPPICSFGKTLSLGANKSQAQNFSAEKLPAGLRLERIADLFLKKRSPGV